MKKILSCIFCILFSLPLQAENLNGQKVQQMEWEQLMPEGFSFESIFNNNEYAELDDFDPQAERVLQNLMDALSSAPVIEELDGKMIQIPGFVVPLAGEGMTVTEFFLVPYFGACIHVPPPPSNQMIHITFEPGTHIENLYDAVSVTGELKVEKVTHELGTSGYKMEAFMIEPYTEE